MSNMGRPPLTKGVAGPAPKLTTCLPRDTEARVRDAAARQGVKVSLFIRKAIEKRLDDLEAVGPPGKTA